MDGFFQQKPQLIQPRPTFYNITIAQLLDPTFSCDQVLDELTADQLLSIERTVGKARKNRESLGRSSGGRIGKPKEKHEPKLRPPLENFPTKKPINTTNQYEPSTFTKDEVEWLCFWYAHKKRMQRHEIRIDVESVNTEDLEHQFKVDNCVYPRAFCSKEEYHGNRWHYETECNDLGWRLSFLNQELLSGKRGLIQRAVDSFRNRHPSLRSRRVARQEKLNNGTLRKRKPRSSISSGESTASSDSPLNTPDSDTLIYRDVHSGALWPVYININEVDVADIDDDFKQRNSVFMRGLMKADYPHLGQQMNCNEIAWKLAWLNPDHLDNQKLNLQRIVDIYRTKYTPHLLPRPLRNPQSPHSHSISSMNEFSSIAARPVPLSLKMIPDNPNQFLTPTSTSIVDDSLTIPLSGDSSTEFLADQFWQQLLKPSM